MKCNKCYEALYKCSDCDGQTQRDLLGSIMTCSTCRSTGWLCPEHKGFWQ
jgi:hypothetical protein